MTSQNFPFKKGTSQQIRPLAENGFNFKNNESLCPESFFLTQNWPPCQFQQFPNRGKIFSFCRLLGRLSEKRVVATPWSTNFAKIWSKHVLNISLGIMSKRFLIGSCEFGHPSLWAPPPPPFQIGIIHFTPFYHIQDLNHSFSHWIFTKEKHRFINEKYEKS